MKKAIIALIILLIAAGASFGAFLSVKDKSDKEAQQKQEQLDDYALFSFDAENVNKMDITLDGVTYTVEKNSENVWELTAPADENFALNETKVKSIYNTLAALTAKTSYGKASDENKARYGLTDCYTVTAYESSGEKHTVYIGEKSPTGGYYYAAADGKSDIYAILADDAESMITDRLSLKSNDLIPYDDKDVVGMKLIKKGVTVYELSFDSNTGLWMLPEKFSMLTVNQSRPEAMVSNLTRLTAEQMMEEGLTDLSLYGFDQPLAEFVITGSDGTEKRLLFSNKGRENTAYINVLLEDDDQAELYYSADMNFINYEVFDFVLQTIENAPLNSVTDFEFSCGEAEDSFTYDFSTNTAVCRGTEIDLENAELKGFFDSFYNSFSYVSVVGIDITADPELKDPVFSARYSLDNGTTVTFDIVSNGRGSECYVFWNGKYTGTLTDSSFVTDTGGVLSAYQLLCSHAGIEPVETVQAVNIEE